MMVVAKVGDDPPTMKKSDLDSWLKRHFGVYYAKGPLIEVEPGLWVICIKLHMNLRITGAMFEHMILKELGRHCQGNSKEREAMALQIYELLIQAGLPMKLLKCPTTEVDSYWESISKYSFAGRDCAVLSHERLWEMLLQIVMPEAARKKNHTLQTRYESCVKAWENWTEVVWPLINNLGFESKQLKAEAVRKAARDFIPLYRSLAACLTVQLGH